MVADAESKAEVLTGLAAAAGKPAANRLLAQAFATGSFATSMPLLSKLAPQVVLRIAERIASEPRPLGVDDGRATPGDTACRPT